jgi:uncharacterized protein (TIGR02246 family)
VDLLNQITSQTIGDDPADLRRAVQVLSDRAAISDLAVLYMMAVDDHDIERVLACFAPDGSFTRAGTTSRGGAQLRAFYIAMMDRYITTLHTPHSHVIQLDSADQGSGLMTGHAELSLDGTLMVAAYRYADIYVRLESRWLFQSRSLQFMYVTPFQEMATTFTGDRRIRWPETEFAVADIPETYKTWKTYRS